MSAQCVDESLTIVERHTCISLKVVTGNMVTSLHYHTPGASSLLTSAYAAL
jgi:hypothetical protein